jgi:hypothetical protein
LNLKCDLLVSKLAFKCNLWRYNEEVLIWCRAQGCPWWG